MNNYHPPILSPLGNLAELTAPIHPRQALGMWVLETYQGVGNVLMTNAWWNPNASQYEIQTPKGLITASLFLDLEKNVRDVYPRLKVFDYATGAAIRSVVVKGGKNG